MENLKLIKSNKVFNTYVNINSSIKLVDNDGFSVISISVAKIDEPFQSVVFDNKNNKFQFVFNKENIKYGFKVTNHTHTEQFYFVITDTKVINIVNVVPSNTTIFVTSHYSESERCMFLKKQKVNDATIKMKNYDQNSDTEKLNITLNIKLFDGTKISESFKNYKWDCEIESKIKNKVAIIKSSPFLTGNGEIISERCIKTSRARRGVYSTREKQDYSISEAYPEGGPSSRRAITEGSPSRRNYTNMGIVTEEFTPKIDYSDMEAIVEGGSPIGEYSEIESIAEECPLPRIDISEVQVPYGMKPIKKDNKILSCFKKLKNSKKGASKYPEGIINCQQRGIFPRGGETSSFLRDDINNVVLGENMSLPKRDILPGRIHSQKDIGNVYDSIPEEYGLVSNDTVNGSGDIVEEGFSQRIIKESYDSSIPEEYELDPNDTSDDTSISNEREIMRQNSHIGTTYFGEQVKVNTIDVSGEILYETSQSMEFILTINEKITIFPIEEVIEKIKVPKILVYDTQSCFICMGDVPNVILETCSHKCVHKTCITENKNCFDKLTHCPHCRKIILGYQYL